MCARIVSPISVDDEAFLADPRRQTQTRKAPQTQHNPLLSSKQLSSSGFLGRSTRSPAIPLFCRQLCTLCKCKSKNKCGRYIIPHTKKIARAGPRTRSSSSHRARAVHHEAQVNARHGRRRATHHASRALRVELLKGVVDCLDHPSLLLIRGPTPAPGVRRMSPATAAAAIAAAATRKILDTQRFQELVGQGGAVVCLLA